MKGKVQSNILELVSKIVFIKERQLDVTEATEEIAKLLVDNLQHPDRYAWFMKIMQELLKKEDGYYAGIAWVALVWNRSGNKNYQDLFEQFLIHTIKSFQRETFPPHIDPETGKSFPLYAYLIGESFIETMRYDKDLYSQLADIYSFMVKEELQREENYNIQKNQRKFLPSQQPRKVFRKLYDEVFSYISERSVFRLETLNQHNPKKFIGELANQLQSTRRYYIQKMVNDFTINKRKALEKAEKAREASAEELVATMNPFHQSLQLFHEARFYKIKYMKVEKIRISTQIVSVFSGGALIALTFWELLPLSLPLLLIAGTSLCISSFLCSKKVFQRFYPRDVREDLEESMELCTSLFRKTSSQQIDAFLKKQLKNPKNTPFLAMMPDFLKYLFDIMPSAKDRVMSSQEVGDTILQLQTSISRQAYQRISA